MNGTLGEFLPNTIVGFTSVGIGVIFLLIEGRTRVTLALSASYVMLGLAMIVTPPLVDGVVVGDATLGERVSGVFEAAAVVCFALWLGQVANTAHASERALRLVRVSVRGLILLAATCFIVGFVRPELPLNDYFFGLTDPGYPGFWIFAGLWVLIGGVFLVAWVTLSFQELDSAEKVRAQGTVAGTPFAIAATLLPAAWSAFSLNLALLIWLVGFFRYFVIKGERGVFMSRFLSPQVAELVRLRGLAEVMRPREAEVSVVYTDLRGFTSYAEAVPSVAVIGLLADYYDAIGEAVAEFDGTIKDYAGDGILILIGAPLPRPEHARDALALATRIQEQTSSALRRWRTTPHPLGLGIGVASGNVTVGAIGSSARMEYTAVGAAVNLAARLCSAAEAGQVLVDQQTHDLTPLVGKDALGASEFKGFANPVPVFQLRASGQGQLPNPLDEQARERDKPRP